MPPVHHVICRLWYCLVRLTNRLGITIAQRFSHTPVANKRWIAHHVGSIPSEIGELSNLEGLFLPQNHLSGELPPQVGKLTQLQYLYLCGNLLNGTMPSELGNLENLHDLAVCANQFSGNIPTEFGNLVNLQYLFLAWNQLSGALPLELTNLALNTFSFNDTALCEPDDAVFQTWLKAIPNLNRTGVVCATDFAFLPVITR